MIEKKRESKEKVWQYWVKAHAVNGQGSLESGAKGFMQGKKKIPYQIIDVVPGESFSILWKAFLIRFVFSHRVSEVRGGSEIRYDFKIQGLCAWMVRWMLIGKIRANLSSVLKEFARQLERS